MFRKAVFILAVSLVLAHPIKAQKDFKADLHTGLEPTDAEVCSLAVLRMEEKYGIKNHLLETISSVETGIWDNQREAFVSWPWSVNVNGKGNRFNSKEEAVAKVKELQAQGYRSIDVGCMQISLKFHGDSFESVEDAMDPDVNVEYSAQFLKKLYDQKGDWQQAAMTYHSKLPAHAQKYKLKLLDRFEKIKLAFLDYQSDTSLF